MRRRFFIKLTPLGTALCLAACGPRTTPVERGIQEQVLHYGNGVEPADLDPHTNTGSPESTILDAIFEPLVRRDGTGMGLVPAAAESWEVSPDGITHTFHLRKGMVWTNGDPVTAADYRDSFKRVLTPSLGSQPAVFMYPLVGAEAYHKGTLDDFEAVGIKALDDQTLVMTLREPTVFFLQTLIGYPFVAVHLKTVEKHGGLERAGTPWTLPENIVTNGPFTLKRWIPNQVLVVERNPDYWGAADTRINEIHFHPIESQDTEERAFRTGQLHVTNALAVSKIETYKREWPEALRITPRLGVSYAVFNNSAAPFDDVRVRRAFSLAIDRQALVKYILRGGQSPAFSLSQKGMGDYEPTHFIADGPEEARRLLAEAGYPDGNGFPPATYLYNTSDFNRAVAQALQEMWRSELGVNIQLQNQEWKVFLNSRDLGNFQIARAGWNPFAAEPTDYFQQLLTDGTFNDSGWSNPEYDALFRRASATLDRQERHALYQRMDEILLAEMPLAPLWHSSTVRLVHPSVQNWTHNLLDDRPLQSLWLKPVNRAISAK